MTAREMLKEYHSSLDMCDVEEDCNTCPLDHTDKCFFSSYVSPEKIFEQFIKELEEKDEEIAVLKERIAIMMEDKE